MKKRIRQRLLPPFNKNLPPTLHTKIHISKIGFDEWMSLVGIEATCKLLTTFENCRIEFTSLKTYKERFIYAIIRADYKKIKDKAKNPSEFLGKKYNRSKSEITHIIKGTKFPMKGKSEAELKAEDEWIIECLKENWDVLVKYDFV